MNAKHATTRTAKTEDMTPFHDEAIDPRTALQVLKGVEAQQKRMAAMAAKTAEWNPDDADNILWA